MKKMLLALAAVTCLSIPASANQNGANPLAGPGRGLAELRRILIVMRSPKYRGIGRTDPLAGSRYVVLGAVVRAA
jgi:hypothetical protein